MKIRIGLTTVLLLFLFTSGYVYDAIQGPLEGSIAVQQLEDNDVTYIAARRAIEDKFLLQVVQVCLCVFVVLLWIGPVVRSFK
jgi:hypothetical protein